MSTNRAIKERIAAITRVAREDFPGHSWKFEEVSRNRHIKFRAVDQVTGAIAVLTIPVSPGDTYRGLLNWVSTARQSLRVAVNRRTV